MPATSNWAPAVGFIRWPIALCYAGDAAPRATLMLLVEMLFPQEDDKLRKLIDVHGAKKWSLIASLLGSKGSKQVRRRGRRHGGQHRALLTRPLRPPPRTTTVPEKVEELPERRAEKGRMDQGGAPSGPNAHLHASTCACAHACGPLSPLGALHGTCKGMAVPLSTPLLPSFSQEASLPPRPTCAQPSLAACAAG
jgi:hypothetical protein